MLDALLLDLRHAVRALSRRPLLALAAILTLATGIAANTALFSVVRTALFKPVPGVSRPDRLALITRLTGREGTDVSFRMYQHLAEQPAVLEGLAALSWQSVSIEGERGPVARGALAVAGDYFGLLGVRAPLGRTFVAAELDGVAPPAVAVISHELWRAEFAADPAIVERGTRLNGSAVQIIGVLPAGFAGHHTGLLVDVFVPIRLPVPGIAGGSVELLGRLRAGTTPDAAARALSAAADGFARTTGEATSAQPYAIRVDTWGPLPAPVRGSVAAFLGVLLLLVGLALAMACLNVATVLLARMTERQRELAVRRALGAGEGRLARQILTEVGVLFAVAGMAGVIAAAWLVGLIRGVTPPVAVPGRLGADFGLDAVVLVFAIALTLGSALAFSLVPALRAGRFELAPALREGGASESPRRLRLRSGLVGVQVAITSLLLAATLIAARSLATLRALEPGWSSAHVLVGAIDLEQRGTAATAGPALQQAIQDRVAALPGVTGAALATKLPRGGRSSFGSVWVQGIEVPPGQAGFPVNLNRVSPGYFAALRIPLLAGRDFDARDAAGQAPVAIVNAAMARLLWPGESPLERTFHVNRGAYQRDFRVVGVAADAELRRPGQPSDPFYYVPLAQWYNAAAVLHVRTDGGRGAAVHAAVPAILREVAPGLPAPTLRPMDEALGVFLLPQRLAAWVAGTMSVFGLVLALIGVYGVAAFFVTQRGRELAVRRALGATAGALVRLVLARNGRGVLGGLVAGVGLATVATIGAARVVPGTVAADPLVLAAVPLVLAACAAAALLAPLRRLLRRPIMGLLREE